MIFFICLWIKYPANPVIINKEKGVANIDTDNVGINKKESKLPIVIIAAAPPQ